MFKISSYNKLIYLLGVILLYTVNLSFSEKLTDNSNNQENLEYYIKLISNELQDCLNTNGISYNIPPTNSQNMQTVNLNFDISESQNTENSRPTLNIIFNGGNPESVRLANIIEANLNNMYSSEANINSVPNQTATNMANTQNTSLTLDFESDSSTNIISWLMNNIELIAKSIVLSLCEYFGIPFIGCENYFMGIANTNATIFDKPSLNANVIGNTLENSKIKINGQWENWYIIGENGKLGYIQTKFVNI